MEYDSETVNKLLFDRLRINWDEISFENISDYTAIEYFLTIEDEPSSNATNLEKVNRYLQSFYHLCQVEDWQRANKVISVCLGTSTKKELYEQLGIWGYFQEQIKIYEQLLDNLNQSYNFILLIGLGKAYQNIASYEIAKNLFQRSFIITEDLEEDEKRAIALSNLAGVYGNIGQSKKAIDFSNLGNTFNNLKQSNKAIKYSIDYSQQSLKIALNIGSKAIEARALGNLGNVYGAIKGEYKQAIVYLEECLTIARDINNFVIEAEALDNLGNAYAYLKNYEKAFKYFKQAEELARQIENRANEAIAIGNLGEIYRLKKEYSKAIKCQKQSLKIAEDIGTRQIQTIALGNLGAVHGNLKNYEEAIDYFKQSLALAGEIENRSDRFVAIINLCKAYPLYYVSKIFK